MDALTLLLLGAVVTAFTQVFKRIFPNIKSIYIVAFIAICAGLFQAFILPLIPVGIWEKIIKGFTAAITFYEIILRTLQKQ